MWWLYLTIVNSTVRQECVPFYHWGNTGPGGDSFVKGHPVCSSSHSGSAWGCRMYQLIWPLHLPLRSRAAAVPRMERGNRGSRKWGPFLVLTHPVSVPALVETVSSDAPGQHPFHHTRLHPRLCTRKLNRDWMGLLQPLQSKLEGRCRLQQRALQRAERRVPTGLRAGPAGPKQGCVCFVWKDLQMCRPFPAGRLSPHRGRSATVFAFHRTGFSGHSPLPLGILMLLLSFLLWWLFPVSPSASLFGASAL